MERELNTILRFLRKLTRLYQMQKWEREARKAIRDYDYHRAKFAHARIHELEGEMA